MLLCAKTIQKKKYAQAAPFAFFFYRYWNKKI